MRLEETNGRADSAPAAYIMRLGVDDIGLLEKLEDETRLAFWGKENYRRFLEEFPEYFGCKAVVAERKNPHKLVGFFLARSLFDNLEILKIGVYNKYQNHGIGTLLMEAAYAEGSRRGCRRCFLEVRKSNENAIRFYQRHSFKIAGTRLNYYTDPVEDAWIMERVLSQGES
jgi:ribosomal-protein-alanine N-acetyltransferase